jgi:hypothetical protein
MNMLRKTLGDGTSFTFRPLVLAGLVALQAHSGLTNTVAPVTELHPASGRPTHAPAWAQHPLPPGLDYIIVVSDIRCDGPGRLIGIAPLPRQMWVIGELENGALPVGLAWHTSSAELYVAICDVCNASGAVLAVNLFSGETRLVTHGGALEDPCGIGALSQHALLVADPNAMGGGGAILEVDVRDGSQSVISKGGWFQQPVGLTLAPGNCAYVIDREALTLFWVDLRTGRQVAVSSSGCFRNPIAMVLGPPGVIYVADADAGPNRSGAVFCMDTRTGAQTVVTEGGLLISPVGLAWTPQGELLVVDHRRLVLVDVATGDQEILVQGGLLTCPWGVVVLPANPGAQRQVR